MAMWLPGNTYLQYQASMLCSTPSGTHGGEVCLPQSPAVQDFQAVILGKLRLLSFVRVLCETLEEPGGRGQSLEVGFSSHLCC